mgnify:FL=1
MAKKSKVKKYVYGGPVLSSEEKTQQQIKAGKEYRRKHEAAKRTSTQAKRKASRSPGGFAGGGAIESYSAQVQRKYGGGKV